MQCHTGDGVGLQKSGLDMTDYESLMKGTRLGPVITPNDSASATLLILVEGKADPSINMPHGTGDGLTEEQIATLRAWIDQGATNN
jgi:hypothetical protein